MMKTNLLLMLLLAFGLVAGTAQANMLLNPGFEEGTFTGSQPLPDFWAHYYTYSPHVHSWASSTAEAHLGEKYMKMYNWLINATNSSYSGWLGQEVSGMKEDGDYTFTVWAKNAAEDQTNEAGLEVTWRDSFNNWIASDFVTIPVDDSDWVELDFGVFTAPSRTAAGTIWLAAPVGNGLNAICYDDVSMLGPDPNVYAGPDMISWDGETVSLTGSQSLPGGYSTIKWTADPNTDVEITNPATLTPTVTITLPSPDLTTYKLRLDIDGKYDIVKIDVYPDACAAKLGAGRSATDLVGDDCITDLADLAEVAATWAVDNALMEPTAKEDSSAAVANADDLIAYWPFDEGTGDIAYDAIGDNDAQITGCTWLLPGKIGDAAIDFADFPGSGDEINCGPDVTKYPDLTVAFWIRANSVVHMRAIYAGPDEYSTEPGWRVLLLDTGGVLFRVHGTSGDLDGGDLRIDETVYRADTWVHMTFTFDSETRELNGYINGDLKGTTTVVEGCSVATTAVDLLLGTYSGMLDALDEVAIWNIALTADHVRNVYESGVGRLIATRNPSPSNGGYVSPTSDLELSWTNIALDPNDPDDPNAANPIESVYVDVWFWTDPNDFNKIVGAVEGANSATVDVSTLGTYYWQVNSYIYGDPAEVDYNDPTDPNSDPDGFPITEGFIWRFHAATDVPVLVDAADMVTWSGEPVALDPNIDDDGVSPLTIVWSSDNPVGTDVLFSATDIEDPTVTITKDYSVIPIKNHSFEDPVRADGTQGSVLGWIRPDSWAMVWNPGDDTDGYNGYDGIAPDGENIIWVNGVGAVSQVLADTLIAGSEYKLSVYVGVNAYYGGTTYKVELVAGETVLAVDDNSIALTPDEFELTTIIFDSNEVDPALLGEPLQIRLWCTLLSGEANFDDVHLTVDPDRPLSGAVTTVTLTVSAEDDTGSDKDTMMIDVYDAACPAAIVGLGKEIDPGDFDVDCDTDLKDFATMAEEWLVNNELTESVEKP